MENHFLEFLKSEEKKYWDLYLIVEKAESGISPEELKIIQIKWYDRKIILEKFIEIEKEKNIFNINIDELSDIEFLYRFLKDPIFSNSKIIKSWTEISEWRKQPHWQKYYDSFKSGDLDFINLEKFIFGMFAEWVKL